MRKQRVAAVFCTYIALAVLLPSVFSQQDESAHPAKQAGKSPVKVFILAGQSNMEGQAVADLEGKDYNDGKGTLNMLMGDPAKAVLMRHLKDDQGRWTVRDDVWVRYKPENGPVKAGPLTLGFTVYDGRHHFGPELQFGHVMGDSFENQVLLIKTAWGGKSLYQDFRPPSSGGTVGPYYTRMLADIHEALAKLKIDFPGYNDGGYELAGFVWYHGWNDGCDPKNAIPEYEQNLVNFIKDVRKDLNAPRLPLVIGELTGPWVEAPDEWATLRKAQANTAARPEFAGTVLFVETHDFVRKPEESPNPGHGHHEFGNAETYFLVGNALGEGIKKLLTAPQPGTKPGPSTPLSYTARNLEGWTVRISDQLMETEREATMKAVELLTAQLSEIVRVVPAPALAVLRSVPLWVSPLYPGQRQPRAEYHPDAGWLRDHGRNPAMAKAVEFTNVSIFEAETRRMPNFALHELAHAYHDRVLGYDHRGIKDAYEKAKAAGRYDRVEQRFGDGRSAQARAYAMTDPQEYFAETTEAFFSTNDFFPFTRDELKRHDPEMFDLLAKLWGSDAKGNNPSAGPLRH